MKFFLILILLLFATALYGQPPPCPSFHHLYIGPNYTRAYVKPSANPSFQGNLGGMQGIYEYKPFDFLYAGAKLDWRYGSVHASNGKRTLLDVNVAERLGYTFAFFNHDFLLTLWTGFGYRHLSHHLKLNRMDSIKLRYNHFYVPVALFTDYKINSFFSVGVKTTWMAQVFSSVYISPIGGAYWKIRKKFKNFLVEVPLTFLIQRSRNLSIVVNPFFEFWQDGSSTANDSSGLSLGLPKNTYVFWGGDM